MQVKEIGIEVERDPLEDQFHSLRIENNEVQNDHQIEKRNFLSDQIDKIEKLYKYRTQLEIEIDKQIEELHILEMAKQIVDDDDDYKAISRLMRFGYERHTVIMLYLVCDKDEVKTTNLLKTMNFYK